MTRNLLEVPFKEKRELAGYFEEVAFLLNSGLIRLAVAHYLFGHYAIRCRESDYFWSDLSRESDYWELFRDFVARMKEVENFFTANSAVPHAHLLRRWA